MEFLLAISTLATVFLIYRLYCVYKKKRVYLSAYNTHLAVSKVGVVGNVALFVRSDGRIYRKFYDEHGSACRTPVSLVPWGLLTHRSVVSSLQSH